MKPAAVILSGLALALTGASTRTCFQPIQGWCGDMPGLARAETAACLGYAVLVTGAGLLSFGFVRLVTPHRRRPKAGALRTRV